MNSTSTNRHRMTYERAGYIFRAMKLVPFGILWDASDMGLVLPDDGKFDSFCDLNADRLQLFDPPKKLKYVVRAGYHGWSYIKELS
jgi:hypothetical protein